MYTCVNSQKSENVSKKFQFLWEHEMRKAKPSLFKVMMKTNGYKVVLAGALFSLVQLPCK